MREFFAKLRIEGGFRIKMILCYTLIVISFVFQSDILLSISLELEALIKENRKLNWVLYYALERNRLLRKRLKMFDDIKDE